MTTSDPTRNPNPKSNYDMVILPSKLSVHNFVLFFS